MIKLNRLIVKQINCKDFLIAKISIFALSLGMFSVIGSSQASAHTAVANGAT